MKIQFKHIIPKPIQELVDQSQTEIWNLDLELNSGENIIIEAPSGKGKSTFLNIIFGIRQDYSGELWFDQDRVSMNTEFNWDTIRTSKISMVHQGLELFDHFTAWQNVILNNNISRFKTEDQISQMFEMLDISNLRNKPCQNLSFGQKQRVAIIRALCQPYKWLLLDEPFSHLDKELAQKALELIVKEASVQNSGILLTSLNEVSSKQFNRKLNL